MAATTFVKYCKEIMYSEKKKLFPAIKHSFLRGIFFRNNYFDSQPFLMSCYFTNILVHLSVIAALCYFCIYKWIGWDQTNIFLSKVNNKNIRKRCEICPKFTINKLEIVLVSLLLTLNILHTLFIVSIVNFE